MLKYKPIFTLPKFYIKYHESVYEGYENFSFNELNYEISQKDIRFLENSRKTGLLKITNHDFEKVIDVFEKIVFLGES